MTFGNRSIYLATLEYEIVPSINDLNELAKALALLFGLHPIDDYYACHNYSPDAVTFTKFLAESHVTFDTYPESKILEVCLSSCKDINPSGARYLFDIKGYKLKKYTVLTKQEDHSWLHF